MNVLIVGSGGREHALAWKMAQSPQVTKVYVAPGNGGTATEKKVENIPIKATEIEQLLLFAKENQIALTVVGPEDPLVLGIVDRFQDAGLACFGPPKAGAQLEGSKQFAKDFMSRHNIPTAEYRVFTDPKQAKAYLKECDYPIVIKADGLAAGKGVVIAENESHAVNVIDHFMTNHLLGHAGDRVVIERFLKGQEVSFIVMVDGNHTIAFPTSQDHKARDDGDLGPNTGGMGAYSPAPLVTPQMHEHIMQTIIKPTIQGLAEEGVTYRGFLYAGLMLVEDEGAYLLEYNCRLGDPEAQVLLFRLKSDFYSLCQAAVQGKLDSATVEWLSHPTLGVVLASQGYPEKYPTGEKIVGIPQEELSDGKVFHAGTVIDENKQIITSGGRVLCAVAMGENLAEAQTLAYILADKIEWPSRYCRRDIGYKALKEI